MTNSASLVVRLNIFSTDDNSIQYVEKIKSMLPEPDVHYVKGEQRKLSTGQIQPFKNKSTQFIYEREFLEITDIEVANKYWIQRLKELGGKLNEIKSDYGYKIQISYEITVKDESYPAIIYSGEFNKILGDLNIDLALYFYSDS